MYPKFEQRGCLRFENEIPIVLHSYNAKKHHKARIYNRTSSGIYFESDIPINPGAEIYININHSTLFSGSDHCVKVVWCKEIHEAVVFYRFGMGARYCSPVENSKFVSPKLRVIQGGKSLR